MYFIPDVYFILSISSKQGFIIIVVIIILIIISFMVWTFFI